MVKKILPLSLLKLCVLSVNSVTKTNLPLSALILGAASVSFAGGFKDITADAGLPDLNVSRVLSVDLNADGHADLSVRPNGRSNHHARIFLNTKMPDGSRQFVESPQSGLPELAAGDVLTYADVDNDGLPDAILARYLDYLQPDFAPPAEAPTRSSLFMGRGDGSFSSPRTIEAAPAATTAAIAVHDVNGDGLPDLWFGNWYERYFSGYEAFSNDLLLQFPAENPSPQFVRWSVPGESEPIDGDTDSGGRPTYGVSIARLDDGAHPHLIELNYGRRWNRLYDLSGFAPHPAKAVKRDADEPPLGPRPGGFPAHRGPELARTLFGTDIAPAAGFDGDKIRHGIHPKWLQERAQDDPRFKRDDEPPFRANGNTFDAAIGDIDNDGDFDVFVSTIIHNWAGDSSDKSRFLVNRLRETGEVKFDSPPELSVDRVPDVVTPENRNFNQGDIFCELADLNNDGRLDLILCSSDYSDPPPHDERLRIYLQQTDGTFHNATAELGIDHLGGGQPTLFDWDRDGDLDLTVGQTFNRLNAERRREAGLANGTLTTDSPEDAKPTPRLRLYQNTLADENHGVVLRLIGDPDQNVARDAYGAIVRASVDLDNDPATPDIILHRQLIGPGGHAGKRSDSVIHLGLGQATQINSLEITWPNPARTLTEYESIPAGSHTIQL
ncbi:MAG: hypothetical protein SynsKO_29990 [Synoicihabitans sp.]